MALSQKLAQFNKQQEKLQASLAKINQSRPAPAPQPKVTVSRKAPAREASQNSVPFSQRFSFTNDTEKLTQIATIRRAPVGAQIKRVLDLLLETRQSLLPEEINESCFVDVSANKELLESLKSNVKVSFDGQRFAYKSKHDIKCKQELLVLIRKVPEGIPMGDLKDSYPGVISDVQELKASGDIWLLMNSDSQEDIAYPNDPRIKIKVDEDLKQLIRSIEMPREFIDVERELTKAGMKPATNTARREALKGALRTQQTQKKTKKRRETKRTKYTNAHLPELFQMNLG
ncbi:transcription initiation factor TFIIE subunit beta [Marchantia polymorpha subsp. ruderalis]|uniref:Transcription initiation factor IIE subunit beta n=2 Tax=Marchantia polymorpha TaxID=3197 RepID=A0A176VY11_MARPO|nr:hypothetical protein AXG93_4368s1590 [Marchantia polymorpha subsp. ruderalis]PTQ41659.1 hypothetical protein MARPO_0033s0069 [Marchantia polymorpha]BBM98746.1 hypothetical protein Mp_1g15910 [Marchantia polymorpha subsp. ruderalis]|eukprot:PTQ41659.1 hypothetical protein MARPO_0033s0069 [Marchantia polymorpha]